MSQPIRGQSSHLNLPIGLKKKKLGRECWYLLSCQNSLNSLQQFQRRSRKCLSQSETKTAILFFLSAQKNKNLVEDVEISLPVKFRWMPFSNSRNISTYQRPRRPSYFSDRPEKHKLGRKRLWSCFLSNFVEFRSVVSEKKSKMRKFTRDDGQTDRGWCTMTIAHLSLQLW